MECNISKYNDSDYIVHSTSDNYVFKMKAKISQPKQFEILHILDATRGSAIAEEPRDALRQLKYYGRFLTELLTRSSANPEEPCEHNVS